MKVDRLVGPALIAINKKKFYLVLASYSIFTRKKDLSLKIPS